VCVCADEEEVPGEQPDKNELQQTLKTLTTRLDDMQTCSDLLTKHQAALQRALADLEKVDGSPDSLTKVKGASERATLFRITCNAMIKVRDEF
jgi:hypothetical protein